MAPRLMTKAPLKARVHGGDVQSTVIVENNTKKTVKAGTPIHVEYCQRHMVIELDDDLVPGEILEYNPTPYMPSGGGSAEAYYYVRVLSPSIPVSLKNAVTR